MHTAPSSCGLWIQRSVWAASCQLPEGGCYADMTLSIALPTGRGWMPHTQHDNGVELILKGLTSQSYTQGRLGAQYLNLNSSVG